MAPGLLTVAFVDAERSTELLTRRGDDEGLATLNGVLQIVRQRIEDYGGREIKSLGDGLMISFDAPRQAVSFGVAVQRALAGRRPRLRIGMNTGEVAGEPNDPLGEAVNAAARIAAKATGGEVLVSDVVRQLVGSMPGVRFVDRGRSRLRGFPDRWRLHAVAGSDAEPAPVAVFGRDDELAAIDWLLGGIGQGGGRALVLEGEPGIGKSHLTAVTRSRADAMGFKVVSGGADEFERDRPGRILGGLAAGLGVSWAPGGDVGREGGNRGYALVEAILDAVEDAAASGPVVVVVEDLHWADDLSLRGIAALGRRLPPLPVGLVATLRPSPRPPLLERVLEAVARPQVRRLTLGSLEDAALGALVASVTGAGPGPRLTSRLVSTAGNPLFVLELLRALEDDGALRVEAGVVETEAEALPVDLRQTLARRLSALPPDTAEVLRLASLLGGEFALTDLATIAGRSVVDVAARLHEAVEASVLSGEGNTLSFRHDLIREAVYEDMASAIRCDLHAAAGRALAGAGAPVQQVARQMAMGARPGDIDAVEWLERAGREAVGLDPAIAVTLFEQALALAPDTWAGRTRIEAALLEPLAWSGRVENAEALGRAILGRRIDPDDERATRRGLAAVLGTHGDIVRAAAECERAAEVPGGPAGEQRVLRCIATSMSSLVGRQLQEVRSAVEADLKVARDTSDEHLACWAHQGLAIAAIAEGRYEEGLEHAGEARRLVDLRWFPPMGFLIPQLWEGTSFLNLDRFDDAIETCTSARQRAERRGEIGPIVHAHLAISGAHFLAGRWHEAAAELEAGLAVAEETRAHAMTVAAHALLARIALGRGDLAAVQQHVAAGQEMLAAGGGHLFGVDLLFWAQAALLEAEDRPREALAVLQAVWDQTATVRYLLQYRNIGPDLIRLAHDDYAQRSAVAADMEVVATRSQAPSAMAAAQRARGLAEHDADLLLEAATRYRATPRRIELAAVDEEAAALLLARGRTGEAVGLLEEAAGIHVQAGADSSAARIDALLRAHGVRSRGPTSGSAGRGWASLSRKERQVVELVAEGLSNPQIGARLYVSRRTVETHLSHVFRKLGLSNRAQVAAVASRRAADASS